MAAETTIPTNDADLPSAPPEAHQRAGEKKQTKDDFFGDVISTYTRAQAIEDGYLVDVSEMAREAGFTVPVALTRAAWADCVEWTAETDRRKATIQDEAGRLWDVLYMARRAARTRGAQQRRLFELYRVPVQGRGNTPRRAVLAMHIGPGDNAEPVITITLPSED